MGRRSYLKLTHPSTPFAVVILRPLHRGFVKSMVTWILIKLYLSCCPSSTTSSTTSPARETISFAISIDALQIGISWTWIQKLVLSKITFWIEVFFSTRFKATRCLSNDHGSPCITRITSSSLVNTNITLWFPISLTSKPFFVCHTSLKVRAMASTLIVLPVKNLAAMKYSSPPSSSWT